MEGLDFTKDKRTVRVSHYKVSVSHIIPKSTFKDSNHIDTVKPGTLLGITYIDEEGNVLIETAKEK